MTGPEHCRAAERLLGQQDGGADTIQQAMTYAVLALAAATALAGSPDAGTEAWLEAMRPPERTSSPSWTSCSVPNGLTRSLARRSASFPGSR